MCLTEFAPRKARRNQIVFPATCAASSDRAHYAPQSRQARRLRIRFPGDQGRIAIGILMGVGMLSAAVLSRAMPNGAETLATGLAGLSLPAVFALLAALTLVIIAISYTLSVRWIRKKEF